MIQKRLPAILLALCLMLPVCVTGAGAVDPDTAVETVRALGIMTGDSSGDLKLDSQVTRAQFAAMMTCASSYKDSIGTGGGVSLFRDVKKDHWASEYIRLAVNQGWMSGYVDGSFRPEQSVTLEEACASLLTLLGFNASSLAGSYPYAQLSKASSVGLLDDLSVSQGQTLTRRDCASLFYNLLVSENSSGAVYGTLLGYTVRNGQVDYSTLVTADTKGPYVAAGAGAVTVPFAAGSAVIYRDGSRAALSAIQKHDVYYYNANLNTIWVYSDRVSGTLTAVSPSSAAPTSVTVAGNSYSLGTSTAVFKCSSQGSFSPGSVVTLLLGKDGDVADVVSASEAEGIYYGVVISSQKAASSSSTSDSSASVQTVTQVACTDGVSRTFYAGAGTYEAGRLVTVTVNGSGTRITSIQTKRLSGTVSRDGTTFANYRFADGVEILDTDSEGGYARIYPSRLAGEKLTESNVKGYTLDKDGRIDRLILQEATGDTMKYAYITSAEEQHEGMTIFSAYSYIQNGQKSVYQSSTTIFPVDVGGAVFHYDNGTLDKMAQLKSVKLTQLSSLYAVGENKSYPLDGNVQVILRSDGGYYPTALSEIDSDRYTLTGWYDDLGYSAGGRIRIIVAVPKQ